MASTNMTNKIVLGVIGVGAILGALAFFGLTPYGKSVIEQFGSPVGATFNTAKVAQINITPSSNAATTTSILNTDASARWVSTSYANCTGANYTAVIPLANLTVTMGTTSTNAPVTQLTGNSNTATVNVSTTTPYSVNTGTAPTVPAAYWASGTYWTFAFNASTTAVCSVGVYYFGS